MHREVGTNLTRHPVLEEDKQEKEEGTVNEEEGKGEEGRGRRGRKKRRRRNLIETTRHK